MPPFSALDAGGRNNDPSMQAIRLSDPLSKTMPVPLTQQNRPNIPKRPNYAVRIASDLSPLIAACAAASLAIGTRYGEHET